MNENLNVWRTGVSVKITEVINAHGHENIQATHKTTLEVTKESTLTKRGDCVIAVGATKGAADLHSKFKETAQSIDATITIIIEVGDEREIIRAKGSPQLLFTHPTDLVIRKSDYVCGRTLAIKADKAASDLSRKLIERMQEPGQRVKITLTVDGY